MRFQEKEYGVPNVMGVNISENVGELQLIIEKFIDMMK
jgi:hypothetical protein